MRWRSPRGYRRFRLNTDAFGHWSVITINKLCFRRRPVAHKSRTAPQPSETIYIVSVTDSLRISPRAFKVSFLKKKKKKKRISFYLERFCSTTVSHRTSILLVLNNCFRIRVRYNINLCFFDIYLKYIFFKMHIIYKIPKNTRFFNTAMSQYF